MDWTTGLIVGLIAYYVLKLIEVHYKAKVDIYHRKIMDEARKKREKLEKLERDRQEKQVNSYDIETP